MRRRGLLVILTCYTLLATFTVTTAKVPTAGINRPPPIPGDDGIFRVPPECNNILGRELPKHCLTLSRRHSLPARTDPLPVVGKNSFPPSQINNQFDRGQTPSFKRINFSRPADISPRRPSSGDYGVYSGPPECNPNIGRELPKHCKSTSLRPLHPARAQPFPSSDPFGQPSRRPPAARDNGISSAQGEKHPAWARDPPGHTTRTRRPYYVARIPPPPLWRNEPTRSNPQLTNPNTYEDPVNIRATRGAASAAVSSNLRDGRAIPVLPFPTTSTGRIVEVTDVYVPFSGKRLDMFDWRLVRELDKFESSKPGGARNAVVSPVGVKMVLGLLHEAASKASAAELRRALGLPASHPSAREAFRHILQSLEEKQDGYIMKVGNRIYLDQFYQPHSNTQTVYRSYYNAKIVPVDFKTPSAVKPIINTWVSNFTNGLIQNLIINDGQVANLISMILNVIYFKGDWLHPFSKQNTAQGPFYVSPSKTVTVDYMILTRDLYYSESQKLDAKVLRLPYKGKKYSMFLILPNKQENFNKMVHLITPDLVREQLHSLEKMEVKVKLPKFTFQYTVHLKELLLKLGITRIFTQSDEIFLTTNKTNMVISKVIQKVGLEVNEEGTKATSATEIDIDNLFGGQKKFLATHPFLFFVEDEKTGTVVFIGKVMDPSYVKSVTTHKPPVRTLPRLNTGILDSSEDISARRADKIMPPVAPPQ